MNTSLDIDIESRLPPARKAGRPRLYPLQALEVGDCFFYPAAADRRGMARRIGSSVRHWRKMLPGRDWAIRSEDAEGNPFVKNGVEGVKVWRIK